MAAAGKNYSISNNRKVEDSLNASLEANVDCWSHALQAIFRTKEPALREAERGFVEVMCELEESNLGTWLQS